MTTETPPETPTKTPTTADIIIFTEVTIYYQCAQLSYLSLSDARKKSRDLQGIVINEEKKGKAQGQQNYKQSSATTISNDCRTVTGIIIALFFKPDCNM